MEAKKYECSQLRKDFKLEMQKFFSFVFCITTSFFCTEAVANPRVLMIGPEHGDFYRYFHHYRST